MTFDDFYALYPRHSARLDAFKAWGQIGSDNQRKALEALPAHVRAWQAKGTEKHFIPLPASWLRGERWDDEVEAEIPKPKLALVAWWLSQPGMAAEAARRGVSAARPGESDVQFRARIEAAEAA